MKKSSWFRIALAAWLSSAAALTAQDTPAAQTPPPVNPPLPSNLRIVAGDIPPAAPKVLPGQGLAQHDFFYAGEGDGHHRMFIVRKGKVDWSYENTDPQSKGEISDAMLLSNGNVLFAHQFGVTEITADKKVLWNYDAPPGTEIHTAQAIGREHVVFIRNGNPAKCFVVNTISGATEKEFELPVRNTNANGIHGQFRHARLTAAGTLLVGHMDLRKICEYDLDGKELWSLPVPDLWMAAPLQNGNILMTREQTAVQELDRKGQIVWEFPSADLVALGYRISGMQTASRLANGDTLINNWCNKGAGPAAGTAIQAFEVSPGKQLVWALRAWGDPVDLGPSTTLQVLDEPSAPENVSFGGIK
jgi:outer membrane protein assembly factor BamB